VAASLACPAARTEEGGFGLKTPFPPFNYPTVGLRWCCWGRVLPDDDFFSVDHRKMALTSAETDVCLNKVIRTNKVDPHPESAFRILQYMARGIHVVAEK